MLFALIRRNAGIPGMDPPVYVYFPLRTCILNARCACVSESRLAVTVASRSCGQGDCPVDMFWLVAVMSGVLCALL